MLRLAAFSLFFLAFVKKSVYNKENPIWEVVV